MNKVILRTVTIACIALAVISCKEAPQPKASAAPPAPTLTVQTLMPETVTVYTSYAASLEGVQSIEIRPRTAGFVEAINITEGDEVKVNDILFTINNETQKQGLRTAKAQVKVAEANITTATVEVDKIRPLVEKNIVSKVELTTVESRLIAAQAQLEQAKASLATAKENLSFTIIKSPVNGVVGSLPYKLGSLVSSNDAQPLTTIANIDEVFAYFALNEKELLKFNRTCKGMSADKKIDQLPAVQLIMVDGSTYEEEGKIVAINGIVNARTGTVMYKSAFPNADKLLRSGSSGKVVMPTQISDVLVVPQTATFEIQGQRFVYVVDSASAVHAKEVKLMQADYNKCYLIESGVNAGDRIVVEGISKLRDGMIIAAK